MTSERRIFPNDKGWLEHLAERGVFEEKITGWIEEWKRGSLTQNDILNVTEKVASTRETPTLVEEIKQRMQMQ